jgi:hypothetical protein
MQAATCSVLLSPLPSLLWSVLLPWCTRHAVEFCTAWYHAAVTALGEGNRLDADADADADPCPCGNGCDLVSDMGYVFVCAIMHSLVAGLRMRALFHWKSMYAPRFVPSRVFHGRDRQTEPKLNETMIDGRCDENVELLMYHKINTRIQYLGSDS